MTFYNILTLCILISHITKGCNVGTIRFVCVTFASNFGDVLISRLATTILWF